MATINRGKKYLCRRFVALEIEDIFHLQKPCKQIFCAPSHSVFGEDIFSLYLCDDWYHTKISPGDILHISDMECDDLEPFEIFQQKNPIFPSHENFQDQSQKVIRIDSQKGLVIVLPDLLISPTKIADACSCMRRAVISTRLRGLSCKSNPAAAIGNLKHQFIEVRSPLNVLSLSFCQVDDRKATWEGKLNSFWP